MCDLAPVAHQAWSNIYLVSECGDIKHCLVKVASAVEDPHHCHRTACKGWTQPGSDKLPVCVLNYPHHPRSIQIRGLRTSCLWAAQPLRHQHDRDICSEPSLWCWDAQLLYHSQWEWPVWLYLSCSYMQKAQRLSTSIHQSLVAVSSPVLPGPPVQSHLRHLHQASIDPAGQRLS